MGNAIFSFGFARVTEVRHIRKREVKHSHVVENTHGCSVNRVFPQVDHSGNNTRIVLEQNKFSKKVS